jgi:hypothetical protein
VPTSGFGVRWSADSGIAPVSRSSARLTRPSRQPSSPSCNARTRSLEDSLTAAVALHDRHSALDPFAARSALATLRHPPPGEPLLYPRLTERELEVLNPTGSGRHDKGRGHTALPQREDRQEPLTTARTEALGYPKAIEHPCGVVRRPGSRSGCASPADPGLTNRSELPGLEARTASRSAYSAQSGITPSAAHSARYPARLTRDQCRCCRRTAASAESPCGCLASEVPGRRGSAAGLLVRLDDRARHAAPRGHGVPVRDSP